MESRRSGAAALEQGGGEALDGVGANGTALFASLLALMCVCAAVLVYRAVICQRKDDSVEGEKRTERRAEDEEEERSLESTEGSDDGASEDLETDSSEAIILPTVNHTLTSSHLLEEDLSETNHKNLCEPTVTRATVSLNNARETGGQEHLEIHQENIEDHLRREGDVYDGGERTVVTPNSLIYKGKPSQNMQENGHDVEESEPELHGDSDEPSETESAQETMETKHIPVHTSQSVEDLLDNTLLAQDITSKPGKEDLPVAESLTHISSNPTSFLEMDFISKTNDLEVTKKDHEMKEGHLLCDYDERSDLVSHHLGLRKVEGMEDPVRCQFDSSISSIAVERYQDVDCDSVLTRPQPQNYLGFTSPCLPGEVQLQELSRERKEVKADVPTDVKTDKNEINIMEAIMDSNEWLGTGPPDTRDLPWLTQSQSSTGIGFTSSAALESKPSFGHTTWPNPAPNNTSSELTGEGNHPHQEKIEALKILPEQSATTDNEEDLLNKKVAAVSPMPQLVPVTFRVHYITHSPSQLLAVTGNQPELGVWENFAPLRKAEEGFWTGTVDLPAESQLEWKFVLVDDGKIRRWEECGNRHLFVTEQKQEIYLNKCWGHM